MIHLFNEHKQGILKLALLLAVFCLLKLIIAFIPNSENQFVLNESVQCILENQQLLEQEVKAKKQFKYYVNSLTDAQGYFLGLSTKQLDRLLKYQDSKKTIYSLKQFVAITQIEDSLVQQIKNRLVFAKPNKKMVFKRSISEKTNFSKENRDIDLNKVTANQLKEILELPYFIAERIVKFRKYLKGYRSIDQINEVYKILPYQVARIRARCFVKKESFVKQNIYNLSELQLSKNPYIGKQWAKQIIKFVKNTPEIKSFKDFNEIEGFSADKINRLPLYLTLEK